MTHIIILKTIKNSLKPFPNKKKKMQKQQPKSNLANLSESNDSPIRITDSLPICSYFQFMQTNRIADPLDTIQYDMNHESYDFDKHDLKQKGAYTLQNILRG